MVKELQHEVIKLAFGKPIFNHSIMNYLHRHHHNKRALILIVSFRL